MDKTKINNDPALTIGEKKLPNYPMRRLGAGVLLASTLLGAGTLVYELGEGAGRGAIIAEQQAPSNEITVDQDHSTLWAIAKEINPNADPNAIIATLTEVNTDLTKPGHVLQPGEAIQVPLSLYPTLPHDTTPNN